MGLDASSPALVGSLVVWQDIFSATELDAIERFGDGLAADRAELAVNAPGYDAIRITDVSWFPRCAQTDGIYARMEEIVLALNARYFHFDLSGLVPFQYAVYRGSARGHFDWHKDYGRDLAAPHIEPRKLTLSLQLSEQADYEGGELQARGGHQIDVAPKARGTLVAFPANLLHRVTPIMSGVRKSLVIWASGPEFR